MTVKIGYQGIEGSNSQASARSMAERLGWTDVEYIPLVHSRGVVDALRAGTVDYGVMAISTNAAGIVEETHAALSRLSYQELARESLVIHHCLFVKNCHCTQIDTVASHIQALIHCEKILDREYPGTYRQETEDTAIAARYLAEGMLPSTTGILCRRDAGEALGLYLLRENVEGDHEDITTFVLIRPKETQTGSRNRLPCQKF